MEKKDIETLKGWQLNIISEALEKYERIEDKKPSADCISRRRAREGYRDAKGIIPWV